MFGIPGKLSVSALPQCLVCGHSIRWRPSGRGHEDTEGMWWLRLRHVVASLAGSAGSVLSGTLGWNHGLETQQRMRVPRLETRQALGMRRGRRGHVLGTPNA